jgi:hypothetical protein
MPSKKSPARKKKRTPWSASDLKLLRQQAGKKSLTQLSRLLKRSEPAIRFQASMHRLSLRLRAK